MVFAFYETKKKITHFWTYVYASFPFEELTLEVCPNIADTFCMHAVYKPIRRIIICNEFCARYMEVFRWVTQSYT
jgi:hypothetical protein